MERCRRIYDLNPAPGEDYSGMWQKCAEGNRAQQRNLSGSRGARRTSASPMPEMSRLCPRPTPAPAGIVRPPSETTAMVAASLSPRRGELFEFAVHGAPRSFHRVDARREPSERCNQPRNVDPGRTPDGAIHIHFRIRHTSQSLYVHEAPPGVTALEILRQPLPPQRLNRKCHAITRVFV